jgi:NAD(P)-dependent dehydrogenase (short-subunit alcohol dehydrogenase family)
MFQNDLLKDRAVFITGGGTGLGRSMSLRLAGLGAKMFLTGRREEPLRETATAIRKAGGECEFATCDVRDSAAVEAVATGAERQFGAIDTLINNAAGNFMARTENLSPNAFHAVVGIVLYGTFHCTTAFGRRWIAGKRPGTVLNIVTTYAAADCCGSGFVVPSACAKAGVLAMTRSLAVEWARHRIRLNAIAPGPFPTEGAFSRLMPSKEYEEHAKNAHPMKRFGRHDELANLAAYLVSEQSEYINGECVVIDGGLWLRGAGEFNDLLNLPDAAWESMEQARKPRT